MQRQGEYAHGIVFLLLQVFLLPLLPLRLIPVLGALSVLLKAIPVCCKGLLTLLGDQPCIGRAILALRIQSLLG